jgi:hypothetical protein
MVPGELDVGTDGLNACVINGNGVADNIQLVASKSQDRYLVIDATTPTDAVKGEEVASRSFQWGTNKNKSVSTSVTSYFLARWKMEKGS